MADASLKGRVAALEEQVAKLLTERANGTRKRDWRRTVGMFTDNPGMQELFADAQRLREADRKKARRRRTGRPRVRS